MGKLEGKRVVFLVGQEFEDIELWYPLLRLSEEGVKAIIVAVDTGLHTRPAVKGKYVTGRFGTTVPPLVHEDGKIITSRVPDDLPDFCLKIIQKLLE